MELALLAILLMCSDHDRLLVTVTPRYLVLLDCLMTDQPYFNTYIRSPQYRPVAS